MCLLIICLKITLSRHKILNLRQAVKAKRQLKPRIKKRDAAYSPYQAEEPRGHTLLGSLKASLRTSRAMKENMMFFQESQLARSIP